MTFFNFYIICILAMHPTTAQKPAHDFSDFRLTIINWYELNHCRREEFKRDEEGKIMWISAEAGR